LEVQEVTEPVQAYPGRRHGYRVLQATAHVVLDKDDEVVQVDGSNGTVIVTLPDAGLAAGRVIRITCWNGNAWIQDAQGNLLDSTVGARKYQSDGVAWHEVRGAQRAFIQSDEPTNAVTGDFWWAG
jgi:hypothetical protein